MTRRFIPAAAAALLVSTSCATVDPCSASRRTMADLRSLATASEAYATDYNNYPDAEDIHALDTIISPTYIRTTPTKDAWGSEFRYERLEGGDSYRFTSAGPDRRSGTADDIIYSLGSFDQYPADCASNEY